MHLATAWLLFCRRRSSFASISAPTMLSRDLQAHSLARRESSRCVGGPLVLQWCFPTSSGWLVASRSMAYFCDGCGGEPALRNRVSLLHFLHLQSTPYHHMTCQVSMLRSGSFHISSSLAPAYILVVGTMPQHLDLASPLTCLRPSRTSLGWWTTPATQNVSLVYHKLVLYDHR
jgi:hypothetical protein